MGYVALKPLELSGAVRHVGQLVPEAATWPNLRAWINQGYVAQVADHEVETFIAALREPGAPRATHFAPSSKTPHLYAAARKMQLDAEHGLGNLPPTGPGAASAADTVDGDEAGELEQSELASPVKAKPQPRKRTRNA